MKLLDANIYILLLIQRRTEGTETKNRHIGASTVHVVMNEKERVGSHVMCGI